MRGSHVALATTAALSIAFAVTLQAALGVTIPPALLARADEVIE